MANDNDRSTLFTTRSTENAMTFFTIIGFLTLVVIFLYHFFQVKGAWYTALVPAFVVVWERVPHIFSFSTLLTVFKEGVDVMLTRLQEYRDRRKQRIAKEVAKEIEKVRKEAYKEGYEAAKAESRSQENKSS
ncbi:hypothetical protein C6500_10870 [Candidatus Poribacteria bacterium]|nr:MAG: hypothetical protein C6500_10870 [Candidatus Poribacteria bacterium]